MLTFGRTHGVANAEGLAHDPLDEVTKPLRRRFQEENRQPTPPRAIHRRHAGLTPGARADEAECDDLYQHRQPIAGWQYTMHERRACRRAALSRIAMVAQFMMVWFHVIVTVALPPVADAL